MKIIGLIPARSGSERIPNKNLEEIQGESLIARAVRVAVDSGVFDEVACSSDSPQILEEAANEGATEIYRPAELATSISRDIDWVRHALGGPPELPNAAFDTLDTTPYGEEYDAFAILRPTNPFRTADTIRRAVKQFQEGDWDSIRAVQPVRERPEKMWTANMYPYLWLPACGALSEWNLHDRQSSTFVSLYIQNGCIQIAKTELLPHSLSGTRIGAFFTQDLEGFDINEPLDLEIARWLAEERVS